VRKERHNYWGEGGGLLEGDGRKPPRGRNSCLRGYGGGEVEGRGGRGGGKRREGGEKE